MAEGKGGLFAILAKPKEGDEEDASDGEAKTAKGRAVKAMFEALQEGKWDDAAEEFGHAYEICVAKAEDSSDEVSSDEKATYEED